MVDALSQRSLLLFSMSITIKGFDSFKYLYPGNLSLVQFGKIVLMGSQESICCMMTSYSKEIKKKFQIAPLREKIIHDMHDGGVGGHFKQGKTYAMIEQKFLWPKMRRDVYKLVKGVKRARNQKEKFKIEVCTLPC